MKREIKQILQYTAIAPSSHNTQPWVVSVEDNVIYLHADFSRRLKHSDPENRELYISLGTALQNTLYAASGLGYKYSLEYFPENDTKTAAAVSIKLGSRKKVQKHILAAMRQRHSNRNIYEDKEITASTSENWRGITSDLGVALNIVREKEKRSEIAEIVADATKDAMADKEFRNELSLWLRHNWTRAHDGMPGYGSNMPTLLSFLSPFVVKNFNVGSAQAKLEKKWIESSPVLIIVSGSGSILDWVKAGQAYERIVLDATEKGIKSATITAAIEIGQYYKKLMRISGLKKRPLVMFRMGYCEKIPKTTPKRTVAEITKG